MSLGLMVQPGLASLSIFLCQPPAFEDTDVCYSVWLRFPLKIREVFKRCKIRIHMYTGLEMLALWRGDLSMGSG